jgi:hypothetical protein
MNWQRFLLCMLAMLVVLGSIGHAGDRVLEGTLDSTCPNPFDFKLRLVQPNHGMLSIGIYSGQPLKERVELLGEGTACNTRRECKKPNKITEATIKFDRLDPDKESTGTYDITLKDGSREQGSFSVMTPKQKQVMLCE